MYQAALNTQHGDPDILLSLAMARMMSTPPQLPSALQDVESVIQRYPANAQAYTSKATICERMGDLDTAEAALLMAIDLSPPMERVRIQQSLVQVRTTRTQVQAQTSIQTSYNANTSLPIRSASTSIPPANQAGSASPLPPPPAFAPVSSTSPAPAMSPLINRAQNNSTSQRQNTSPSTTTATSTPAPPAHPCE